MKIAELRGTAHLSLQLFDKAEIREQLTLENIFELLEEWGGEPHYESFGIVSRTICHNDPVKDSPSRKLYFYQNTQLFHCFSGCENPSFDIFELCIKVAQIQKGVKYDLNDAVRYIAWRFNLRSAVFNDIPDFNTADWKYFKELSRLDEIELQDYHATLKEYDPVILNRFNYNVRIKPWLDEGIAQEIIEAAQISYYPGGEQIVIPHYDQNNRLVGIRGRALCKEEAEQYGKYRPIRVGQQFYSHPLGFNLYNLNHAAPQIHILGKAIVAEGEKSCLLYRSYFGDSNDICVASCGSSFSPYQAQLLIDAGAKEIIIAFDRQFQEINDNEFRHLTRSLTNINQKFKNDVLISFIFDKNMITNYKDSPLDAGPETFLKLYKERVFI